MVTVVKSLVLPYDNLDSMVIGHFVYKQFVFDSTGNAVCICLKVHCKAEVDLRSLQMTRYPICVWKGAEIATKASSSRHKCLVIVYVNTQDVAYFKAVCWLTIGKYSGATGEGKGVMYTNNMRRDRRKR